MFKKITPVLLVLTVFVGCAKKKSYDKKYKAVEQLTKTSIDTDSKYLYVPMTLGTPREVVDAAPFYQGDEKVVRLEWSKDGLEVLEIEQDDRFTDNELNDLPVLTIPGKFAKYKCKEDSYGDCTNTEEEDKELDTADKTHFTPEYEKIKVKEVNMLDAAGIAAGGCTSIQSTKVIDYEISDGVINVELEKTYKLNNSWKCIRQNYFDDKFSFNSFKVSFFYSLVRLDDLATPGYKALNYPVTDHDIFGYFTNEKSILNGDFDSQRKEKEFLLNRWAPERKNKELVYYLSANFSKPKNKVLLDATINSIEVINKGLVAANSPFKIKLVKQEMGKKEVSPGDLRYNTLVLIEDPLANGLLGYGPSVSNPYTGEIVQAHVNMYGGVLKSIVRRVYNNAADLTVEKLKGNTQMLTNVTVAASALTSLPSELAKEMATAVEVATEAQVADTSTTPEEMAVSQVRTIPSTDIVMPEADFKMLDEITESDVNKMMKFRMSEKVNQRFELVQRMDGKNDHLDALEKHSIESEKRFYGKKLSGKHSPEYFPIGGTTKVIYPELFAVKNIKVKEGKLAGSFKRWEDLSDTQKEEVFNIVLVKSWSATLIHEFGHNLGLRHNFAGSRDKDNFYTITEAHDLGMETSTVDVDGSTISGIPAYSSIMDYSFSKFNQLKALGKYDVAALRFAYAREVELNDASFGKKATVLKLKQGTSLAQVDTFLETKGLGRKQYEFCTDGHAGLSSLCNRFDEGTNLTEIAKFRIKRYEDMYKYRNFRDGRLDYSAYNMQGYVTWRSKELHQIRDIIEEYEFFHGIFGAQQMNVGCTEDEVSKYPVCARINDYKNAVELVGDFFVKILKTPDHICALAKADAPTVVVEYRKLIDIYNKVKYDIKHVTKSCFDAASVAKVAEDGMIIVGENGKFLNGFKDTNPNYKYVTDRAVLGTWSDRVFAMKALFSRRWRNSSTDRNHMALIDIPSILEKAADVITHYTLGTPLAKPLPFTTKEGAKFTVPYVIGNDYKIEQFEDAFSWIKDYFGMNQSGESNLVEVAFKQVQDIGTEFGEGNSDAAHEAANIASVRIYDGFTGGNSRSNSKIYYYDEAKDKTYAADENLPVAQLMIGTIIGKDILDASTKEKIAEIMTRRTNPTAPAEMSTDDKVFFSMPEGLHTQLMDLANRGAVIPEANFIQALGPENGPIAFKIYTKGAAAMKVIIDAKNSIMNTPANESEQDIFKLPVNLLAQYLAGKLSPELVGYYKAQLKRLPDLNAPKPVKEEN